MTIILSPSCSTPASIGVWNVFSVITRQKTVQNLWNVDLDGFSDALSLSKKTNIFFTFLKVTLDFLLLIKNSHKSRKATIIKSFSRWDIYSFDRINQKSREKIQDMSQISGFRRVRFRTSNDKKRIYEWTKTWIKQILPWIKYGYLCISILQMALAPKLLRLSASFCEHCY